MIQRPFLLKHVSPNSSPFKVRFSDPQGLPAAAHPTIDLYRLTASVGTNTYILGTGPERLLIDTAQGLSAWSSAVSRVLASENATISMVLLTHWHPDHISGVPHVLSSIQPPPTIHKHDPTYLGGSSSTGSKDAAAESASKGGTDGNSEAAEMIRKSGIERALQRDHWQDIVPNQMFSIPNDKKQQNSDHHTPEYKLQALHTPGHTRDHMTFLLLLLDTSSEAARPNDMKDITTTIEGVFTGDNILGHGTAVFEDLGAYMASLALLAGKLPLDGSSNNHIPEQDGKLPPRLVPLYPGHGAVVSNGQAKVHEYIQHREQRGKEVVGALGGAAGGGMTSWEIVEIVYRDVNKELWRPAEGGVRLILGMLEGQGRVRRVVEAGEDRWRVDAHEGREDGDAKGQL